MIKFNKDYIINIHEAVEEEKGENSKPPKFSSKFNKIDTQRFDENITKVESNYGGRELSQHDIKLFENIFTNYLIKQESLPHFHIL